jgi:hypothetical protein
MAGDLKGLRTRVTLSAPHQLFDFWYRSNSAARALRGAIQRRRSAREFKLTV